MRKVSEGNSLAHPCAESLALQLRELNEAVRGCKFKPEQEAVQRLLATPPYDDDIARRIEADAARIIAAMRTKRKQQPMLDRFLREYGLSDREGIALMCLAESLLRIPDQDTANRLIADKVGGARWSSHLGQGDDHLVNASTWALLLAGRVLDVERAFTTDPSQWLKQLAHRLGEPVIRAAMRQAMRILGTEFVLGRTIEEACNRSAIDGLYSYDMLGEAAREACTAERYFTAYSHAIEYLGAHEQSVPGSDRSVSIKLSGLHPRYEFAQQERVLDELGPRLRALAAQAAENRVALTIDAEDADRLELSLMLFERFVTGADAMSGSPVGLAVQAYDKRAPAVIAWIIALARSIRRRIPVRLVKGAYWDTEIKQAQVLGYPGFPVFTRKASTDLSYLVCARKLLAHRDEIASQFATHNAHTLAAVMALAGQARNFEFQRLHGMGEVLYQAAAGHYDRFPSVRVYAPVGSHEDLLAYLVRRLLENGANSSFVNRVLNERVPPERLVVDPLRTARDTPSAQHPAIASPEALFGKVRRNSTGLDLTDQGQVSQLEHQCELARGKRLRAAPVLAGRPVRGVGRPILNPADLGDYVGDCVEAQSRDVERAFSQASLEQPVWDNTGVNSRAQVLRDVADRMERERLRLIALLVREAGKTYPDAVAEVREAVDFCRYYASEALHRLAEPHTLPGPTGELNRLSVHGRGVFVCISPWNFPLAIFVGQIAAALVAGNTVIAKPAEETPLVAFEAVRLMHEAGIPVNALQLITGDGAAGESLVRHPLTAGVVFTGGTDTARRIHQILAVRNGPIVPLIAETGGQNVLFADSTALLEQVTDDCIRSAFVSAGQRCSALRVLYLQDDIADKTIEMICGAMDELRVGNPARIDTDVGPIITKAAASRLQSHIDDLAATGAQRHSATLTAECANGVFIAPTLAEIGSIRDLTQEHFGPILHVVRFPGRAFETAVGDALSTGYGLTMGLHSRLRSRAQQLFKMAPVGNVYINRDIVGAVVGTQPFGGQGLSGTGPKAGGPHYLARFVTEKVLTVNTTAEGGNAELLLLNDAVPTISKKGGLQATAANG
ncbi:MAG: bifunctional proline dehydrogenase/L-glutamate gamma-semialdehyde dehydrogenase PutA [Gammaproteobacteria bacterium]|nr:bifunctional proline dehydrogenase/L-glutamate gamma-semialdehyde dehydrogenase PutA [Gammaproteobacteria bacterium]MDE0414948.1 bifunctional proline dehydrogenase/L-glutamate gamma-semialdehyde dehydrogenase PutA [Gammaproteobacteria bacterium]